jgi:hypothetical protein
MTEAMAVRTRIFIALFVSAPALLGVYWLVESGFRDIGGGVFLAVFLADFLVLRTRRQASASRRLAKGDLPKKAVWVVGIACFLGSLSLLAGGIGTREIWEVVLGCLGMLGSGWGVSLAYR